MVEDLFLYDATHVAYLSLLALSVLLLETSVHVFAIFYLGFDKLYLLVLSSSVDFEPFQTHKYLICQ